MLLLVLVDVWAHLAVCTADERKNMTNARIVDYSVRGHLHTRRKLKIGLREAHS